MQVWLISGLQAPSPGCNSTIAFWSMVPSSSGSTEVFTTMGQLGTSNPADTIGNSGIRVAHINRLAVICLYDKQNIRHHYGVALLTEGAWTHIAFSYRGLLILPFISFYKSKSRICHSFLVPGHSRTVYGQWNSQCC